MTPRRFGVAAAIGCFLVLLFSAACGAQEDHKVGSLSPSTWTPMETPAVYAEHWKKNVACFDEVYGRGGAGYGTVRPTPYAAFEDMTFFTAGDSAFIDRRGMPVYGEFFPPDTIVLATALKDHVKLVRHEMMHVLGIMYHQVVPFVSCGLWSLDLKERAAMLAPTAGAAR